MENNQYIVAIEIGSTKIAGAIAEKTSMGTLSVKYLEKEEIANCVRYGCVQNVENTKGSIRRIIKKLENTIDGDITDVYVGLNGRSLHSSESEIDRNLNSADSISAATIDSLKKSAKAEPIADYETVSIVPRTYFVDGIETDEPIGRYGTTVKMKFNRIMMRPNVMLSLERTMQIGNIKVKDYIVTPIAEAHSLLSEEEMTLGCMLVDMGAETTTVAIYKNNALLYLTTIPLGGRNITRDLQMGLSITENDAELVKKSIAEPLNLKAEPVVINSINSKEAINYIIARNTEIVANINKQIEYAGLNTGDVKHIVLTGEATKLKGLDEKLSEIASCQVRHATTPVSLNILDHDINRTEYVQLFSLLEEAGEMAPDGHSCVTLHHYEPVSVSEGDGPTIEDGKEEKVENDNNKKKSSKKSWFKKFRDKVDGLMSEDDEDE